MKYRVTAYTEVEVATIVEADSEEEANKIASDREVDICIHGSELAEHESNEDEFVLVDGTFYGIKLSDIEEYE